MYQMTHATAIANATNKPVFNGLLLIAVNADVAKADAAAVAVAMREGSNDDDDDDVGDDWFAVIEDI